MQRSPRLFIAAVLSATAVSPSLAAAPVTIGSAGAVAPSELGVTAVGSRGASEGALALVQATSPKVHALWRPGQPGPSVISGLQEATVGDTPTARALDFVASHQALFGVAPTALRVSAVRPLRERTVVVLQQLQTIDGVAVDVWHRTMAITIDQRGRVIAVSNDTSPAGSVARATIGLDAAHALALQPGEGGSKDGTRVVVVGGAGAFEAAVFQVAKLGTFDAVEVVINLHDGTVSSRQSAVRR